MAAKQTVLITGGSGGLGLAMAKIMAERGYEVVVCGRTPAMLAQAKAEAPALTVIQADVARAEDRDRLMAAFADGCPDMLINNAAINRAHDYTNDFTLGSDRARAEIDINFAAPVELTRLYLAARRKAGHDPRPGTIVMVGTPGALFPLEAIPLYSATKAGLHMFTLVLRRQMRGTAVKVLEVFPPALDTGLAPDLNVASQAANGADVIAQVAAETIDAIEAGQEIILPHPQARGLVASFPPMDEAVVDAANKGVGRRTGWDAGGQ